MPNARKNTQHIAPRWVLRSVAGLVVAFAGFGVFQLVLAQSTYTDPSCDPLTHPEDCKVSGPLLLSAGSKQTLESDVDIGKTGATKTLNMYGAINLNTGSKLQTANANVAGAIAGTAIDIQSSNDYAIYGRSGGTAKAGLYGVAAATSAHGVMAVNALGGYALFVDGSASSGKAARFIGPMELSNGTNDATFSIVSGNLNIQTSVADKGVTVNGQPIASAGVQTAKYDTATANQTKDYDVKQHILNYQTYEVTSIQVLYDNTNTTTSPNVEWVPLPTNKYTYRECTGANFEGKLSLINPTLADPVKYRIVVTYDPQSTLPCTSTSPAPTNVTIYGVTNDYWYSGTQVDINSGATDGSNVTYTNVTKIEFFDSNGVNPSAPLVHGAPGVLINCAQEGADVTRKYCRLRLNIDNYLASIPMASTWADATKTHTFTTKAYSDGGSTNSSTPASVTVKFIKSTEGNACADTWSTARACGTGTKCCGGNARCTWATSSSNSCVNDTATGPIEVCTPDPAVGPWPKTGVCGPCGGIN